MSRQDKSKGNVTSLVFETKSFTGDETPTPTGLIRVGEELGLFDDLQKVNLFEESFRKRVELGPNHEISSRVNTSKGDDLLTPTIFSTNTDTASDLSMGTVEVSDRLMTEDSLPGSESNQKFGMKENSMTDSDMSDVSSTKTVSSVQLMDYSPNLLRKSFKGTSVISKSPLEDAKSKLKSSIMSKSSKKNVAQSIKSNPIFEEQEQSRVRMTSTHSSSDEIDKETMLKRERNRVAAMRSRKKRKTWVEQLEKSAGAMQMLNTKLQTEVTCLRAEVAQLKTLLLAHKDCPVTRAMNQVEPEPWRESQSPTSMLEQLIPDHFLARSDQTNGENGEKANSKLRVLLQKKLKNGRAVEATPVISSTTRIQQATPHGQSIVVVVKSPNTTEPMKKMTIAKCDLDQFIPVIKCNPNAIQSENKPGCESFLSKVLPKTEALS